MKLGTKQQTSVRAAACIFCDEPRDSKEHFWSEWMHPLLPSLPDPRHNRETVDFHPSTGVQRGGRTNAQGGIQTIRIRAVCATCNNGWMSRLEEEVRPLVTPLITGEPVALDQEQTTTIARWIAVKCVVAEHATGPDRVVTPRSDREALKNYGVVPSFFRIYVANHDGEWQGYSRHSHTIALVGRPAGDLSAAPKNIQTITFFLGRVFVHVNAARIPGFELEGRVQIPALYSTARLWPPDHHEMIWPRQPSFGHDDIRAIANTLQLYIEASRTAWLPPADWPARGAKPS